MRPKMKTRKRSFLLSFLFLAVMIYSVISLINQQIDINKLTEERDNVKSQLTAQKNDNAEIEKILQDGNEKAYVERVAREQFHYVKQNEKVFHDISASD